jgi:hypothetical protein
MNEQAVRSVETDVLRIAYVEHGPTDGWPVILSHGFPYDVHSYDEVASILARSGARVITPYTRGFGPTRFVSDDVMRSGQQPARGRDIVQLADALGLEYLILGGFDWEMRDRIPAFTAAHRRHCSSSFGGYFVCPGRLGYFHKAKEACRCLARASAPPLLASWNPRILGLGSTSLLKLRHTGHPDSTSNLGQVHQDEIPCHAQL